MVISDDKASNLRDCKTKPSTRNERMGEQRKNWEKKNINLEQPDEPNTNGVAIDDTYLEKSSHPTVKQICGLWKRWPPSTSTISSIIHHFIICQRVSALAFAPNGSVWLFECGYVFHLARFPCFVSFFRAPFSPFSFALFQFLILYNIDWNQWAAL